MSLTERLLKSSVLKTTEVLSKTTLMEGRSLVPTPVPMMNVALSGELTGGIGCGLTVFAGPSRHFKTLFSMLCVAAYLKAKPKAVCIFYDSEFGAGKDYFESMGIDAKRVIHIPIMNIEELTFDLSSQVNEIQKSDDVIILIDSLGNLASKKEAESAKDENSAMDMTRAKTMKGLWRIVTPYLNLKDIPIIAVNHTYVEQKMYGKQVMSGGQGIMLSADNVIIIGRQQEKDGKEVVGYNFIMNIEKGRYTKEQSKIPISVTFEGGINVWSGLIDVALELGHVIKPKNGWYSRPHIKDDKSVRLKDTNNKDFWQPVFNDTDFKIAVKNKYKVSTGDIISSEDNDLL